MIPLYSLEQMRPKIQGSSQIPANQMSTVLPGWPQFTHNVEDGKYFACTIWSCKFTSLYAMHFTNWSLVFLETIKDKDLFSDCIFLPDWDLYFHHATISKKCFKCLASLATKEYAIDIGLIWCQIRNERISQQQVLFLTNAVLILLT